VGRAFRVRPGEIELAHVRGRILVVHQPLTQYAPLLWKAAGLVSETGGQAAHLCEVARSLHVPAVVGVHLSGVLDGSVIALDGATGEVWHVPAVEIR
jgi:pyruvate,water dikinase